MSVVLETSLGEITVDLYVDERPRCCLNFLKLCKIKYYNFSMFHSVQKNLVAQSGDPSGTGRGGESVFGKLYGEQAHFFEMETIPRIKHTKKGQLSMVNNGGNMHGSQFFLTLREGLTYLDGVHTVFGEVAEGFDILEKINNAYCDDEGRPYQDIRIYHTVILDDPFEDPKGLEIPDRSPEPTAEMLATSRIAADENLNKNKELSEEQLRELEESREAKANAQLLEMVGDIPDVDVKPPENVLFVCKLNPVTDSEDLETIFSRFGPIKSCEVIKDQKTGESLQYAFIEFEKEADCETAYFKMDNVLIDDRRIHVDFSQSVSKLKWTKGQSQKPAEKEALPPRFVIKDQNRSQGNYELVFEDDNDEAGPSSIKKKKHKDRYVRSSSSEDNHKHKNSKGKKKRKKHRTRSRSLEKVSDRNPSGLRNLSRSQSPIERGSGHHKDKNRPSDRQKFTGQEKQRKHKEDGHSEGHKHKHKHKKEDRDRYR